MTFPSMIAGTGRVRWWMRKADPPRAQTMRTALRMLVASGVLRVAVADPPRAPHPR